MIEEQVKVVILARHFDVVLTANGCEALAELEDERSEVLGQATFEIPFLCVLGQ